MRSDWLLFDVNEETIVAFHSNYASFIYPELIKIHVLFYEHSQPHQIELGGVHARRSLAAENFSPFRVRIK